jgi:putative transposase
LVWYWENRERLGGSLNQLYKIAKISKQGFHQYLNRQLQEMSYHQSLYRLVREVRDEHPGMSLRTIYTKLGSLPLGRDRFERLCLDWGLGVPVTRKPIRTTDSWGVKRFENLLLNVNLKAVNEAYVSDITYYEVSNRFYYITFVMDAYSRFILGHSTSLRLCTEQTTLAALQQAIRYHKKRLPAGIIFHSDGGGQYYDQAFLALTQKHQFRNSMCEYAYENGKAERLNGIIKNSYLNYYSIRSFEQLVKQVDRSVYLYNYDRPHTALQRKTPAEVQKQGLSLIQPTSLVTTKSLDE